MNRRMNIKRCVDCSHDFDLRFPCVVCKNNWMYEDINIYNYFTMGIIPYDNIIEYYESIRKEQDKERDI